MPTYHYVIAINPCQFENRLRLAGEIVARHSTESDATLRRARLLRKLKSSLDRDALWVVSSSESIKVGDVSEALLVAATIGQRRKRCTDAMIELLAEEGGTGSEYSKAVISDVLFKHQLTLDELRAEFLSEALAELNRRGMQRQAIAEQKARKDAINADIQRDLNAITYSFPAVRGVQAGREYFSAQIPYAIVAKLFVFDDDVVPPEHRAQRLLNERRADAIAEYMVDNPADYVLPALTCSVSAEMQFEAIGGSHQVGLLHIPASRCGPVARSTRCTTSAIPSTPGC